MEFIIFKYQSKVVDKDHPDLGVPEFTEYTMQIPDAKCNIADVTEAFEQFINTIFRMDAMVHVTFGEA